MLTPITTSASGRCSSASPVRGRSRRPVSSRPSRPRWTSRAGQWSAMFGDAAVRPTVLPEPMAGDVIELEGAELRVIEVGQGDIRPSTVIHVPGIDTVVAGDVIYNQIHAMLGLSGPDEWQDWIASVNQVERLRPATIVAGHKQPEASDQD